MKKLLLLATGGTIACRETENGLSPALSGAELVDFVPKLHDFCTVDVRDLMQLDSTDMTAGDRLNIAQAVRRDAERYDGFVIAHGTDTLAYTAALLYHLLADLSKPVVLTGSMLPMGAPDSDAPRNLLDACRVAADGRTGVVAVLSGKILAGNRVVKFHSTQIDAFLSAGMPPLGTVGSDGKVRWDVPAALPAQTAPAAIDPHILLVKLTPDLDPTFFTALHGYPKVMLETFGAGGIPARLESEVRALIASGTRVYITSQCIAGGVHLHHYAVGRRAEAMGAISLGDRTTEDALAAVMCGEI
ncbi:MAG TPA: asparaginase [Candidatus Agathobaculum pullicola]|nr:asparaginase [Candidatus Agathobaculum pullicola]